MRLILARHGQTDANVGRVLSSRPPGGPLTELGRQQADALAARLAGIDVTAVYASTAVRAQETAAPVAAVNGLAVTVVDGVHEVDVGDFEDRADEQARGDFHEIDLAWSAGDLAARMPGGESATEVLARFRPVVDKITDGASGSVVVVSHGGAIRIVACALAGRHGHVGYLPNTGIVVLRATGTGWELESVDEFTSVPPPGDVTGGGPAG
ncbi:MAG: histidine phosphatase family protein [Pseudonocardia sp.]|nr:histidine phosphatase family protein [Pseudonocardia sp.]